MEPSVPHSCLLPSLPLYPSSFFLLIQQSSLATYLTHIGVWGALCCFKVIQLNLPPSIPLAQELSSRLTRVPSGLLHPHWATSVVKSSDDGLGPSTVSLFYDFSVSKASPVATCAEWTGTMDAALPSLEQHEELAS